MHPDDTLAQQHAQNRRGTPSDDAAPTERTTGRHRAKGQQPHARAQQPHTTGQPHATHQHPHATRRQPRAGWALLASAPARVALAAGVTCCLGVTAFACTRSDADVAREPVAEALAGRSADEERASRSLDRAPAPSATQSVTPAPRPSATRKAPRKPATPPRPRPVSGLTQAQMDNAKVIVDVGVELKMPRRALVVAVSTAMQESRLYNLASGVLPESTRYPHQGSGSDHDSVGLFQQRPSSGWGSVRELMRPAYAARAFYEALRDVPGWQQLSVAGAAQAVQVSAFPDAYARHEGAATTVVAALT